MPSALSLCVVSALALLSHARRIEDAYDREQKTVSQISANGYGDYYPQDTAVCRSKWDTGLKYGTCYTMTLAEGEEPLCRTADEAYMSGGRTCNLILKLCKYAEDCDADAGQWIENNGTWYMQDQIGRVDGTLGMTDRPMPGIAVIVGLWLRIYDYTTTNARQAASFQTAFAQYMFGGCAHCIRFADGSNNYVGMRNVEEHKDWGRWKAFPGPAQNPLNCLAFRFREVECAPGVPSKPVKV